MSYPEITCANCPAVEVGVWNNARQKTGMSFINRYHSFYPKSAPEEDSYGRIVLYTL